MTEPEYGYCTCGRHASDQCDFCKSFNKLGTDLNAISIRRYIDDLIEASTVSRPHGETS